MEMFNSDHSTIRLAKIPLHTKKPKQLSMNHILEKISLPRTQPSHLCDCNIDARDLQPCLHWTLGTGGELSAFREPLESKAMPLTFSRGCSLLRV